MLFLKQKNKHTFVATKADPMKKPISIDSNAVLVSIDKIERGMS
jgi:hypothetical protein